MKKINAKPIIMSALAAIAFGTVSVGTTFALFTDKAETKINVQAGIVDVDNEISIKEVKELGGVDAVKDASAELYTNSIGSTTELLSNKAVKLTNWVPGDKAVFTIDSVNKSNVNIKTRFTVKHTSSAADKDLYPALTISYKALDENNQDIGYKFMDWNLLQAVSEADLANGGKVISKVEVTVEFTDDGDETIRERTEGANNGYQGKDCEIIFTQEAVQGNAAVKSKIEEMNDLLAAEVTPNKTMHEALSDVSSVMDASQLLTAGYVWNFETDRFTYPEEATAGSEYKYFKVYSAMPAVADQKFSVYAYGAGWTTAVDLTSIGFDAGTVSGIPSVSYTNNVDGREVVIRTNGGVFTVNDTSLDGKVYHYGTSNEVEIINISNHSYHEHGEVSFAKIKNGRIVLEEESEVGGIHLVATEQKTESIILATVGEAELPKVTRDEIAVANEGTLVVTIQQLEQSSDEPTDTNTTQIYIYGDNDNSQFTEDTVSKTSEISEQIELLVGATDEETAKYEASEIVAPTFGEDIVASIGANGYTTFKGAVDSLKDGQTLALQKDISLTEDITISNKSFVFEGNNHLITANYKSLSFRGDGVDIVVKNVSSDKGYNAFEFITSNGNINIDKVNTTKAASRGLHFCDCKNVDVKIENSNLTGLYPFNINGGSINTFEVINTKLNGWTSYNGNTHNERPNLEVIFRNCDFGKGMGYATLKPYNSTSLYGCSFTKDYFGDLHTGIASGTETPIKVNFNECTVVDGEDKFALTAELLKNMFNYSITSGSNEGPSTINNQYWYIDGVKVEVGE